MEGRRGAGLWVVAEVEVVVGESQGRSPQQTSNFKILVLISSQKKKSERQTVRREGMRDQEK